MFPTTRTNAWRDVVYKGDDNYYLVATSTLGSDSDGGRHLRGQRQPLWVRLRLPANVWTHLAATYDGATLRLFVNGAQVASKAQTGLLATSTSPLQIGGDSLYGQFSTGRIDEVRVYRAALSPGGDSGGYGGAVGWAAGYDGAVAGVGVGGERGELEPDRSVVVGGVGQRGGDGVRDRALSGCGVFELCGGDDGVEVDVE